MKTYQSKLDIKTSKYSSSDAMHLININKFDEALDICEAALKEDENNYQFLNIKGIILRHLKDYENALIYFNHALEFSKSHEIILNKANTLYDWAKKLHFPDYNNEMANQIIDEAIDLLGEGDDKSEFYFLKAEILEGLGDNIEARKFYLKSENKFDELNELENHLKLFNNYKNDTLINITGYQYYKGLKIFDDGIVLKLIKDPSNEHDSDAIAVFLDNEKVGYVANSKYSVIDEVKSASDIKNLFEDSIKAEVVFIYLNELVIARLIIN